jgi:radical SAM superfamily enzyme YgiQ (UPF0313 family)
LGLPAWDLIDPRGYPLAPQGTFLRRTPFAPVIATRGCPYLCKFCGAQPNSGNRLRRRSPEKVVDEVEFLVREFGVREIHLQDDNFTLNRGLVEGFCKGLIERGLEVVWSCPNGVRLDTLDQELLRLMEESGCYSLAIGIESGVQRVLDLMKKDLKLETVLDKIALIRKTTRIRLTGFFVLGFPGETAEEVRRTVDFSLSLDLDKANYGTFMPIPGSAAYQELKDAGALEGLDLGLVSEYRSPYAAPGLSTDLLRRELRRAFLAFYLRPRIIARFLGEIRSLDQVRIVFRRLKEILG